MLLLVVMASAAFGTPVLVRELVGHPLRVYEDGQPITKDYRPERVNIVLTPGTDVIMDIWFG